MAWGRSANRMVGELRDSMSGSLSIIVKSLILCES
jgi:hypothetical protein